MAAEAHSNGGHETAPAIDGEKRELESFVRGNIGRVRAMLYHMVLNNADADDLTQEVFLRAVQGLSGFDNRASLSTWLYRIAVNTARTFLKRRAARPLTSVGELPETADRSAGESDAGELGKDADVSTALASLSPKLRAAIVLTGLHGLSAREAAKAEGCPLPTMYWRVFQARKLLRKRLERYLKE